MAEGPGRGRDQQQVSSRDSVKVTYFKFHFHTLTFLPRYNIPYLIDQPGTGNRIHGEVYEVDEKMLMNLDILEDHPNYYQRRPEKVSLSHKGK